MQVKKNFLIKVLIISLLHLGILSKFFDLTSKLWTILVQAVCNDYLEVVQKVTEHLNQCLDTFKVEYPEVESALKGVQHNGIQVIDYCYDIMFNQVQCYDCFIHYFMHCSWEILPHAGYKDHSDGGIGGGKN